MSTLKTNKIENLTTTDGGISIDNSGRIGLGTSSPSDLNAGADDLVVGSGSGDQGITIYTGDSNQGSFYFADGTDGTAPYAGGINYGHSDNELRFLSNGSTNMRLDSSGRLLLGTTDAGSGQLTVASTSHTGITIRSGSTSTNSNLIFADAASGGDYGLIQYKHSDDSLRITANNSERVRIASSGQIGLGGANYGTSGQVITSNGSSSAPTWQDVAGGISMAQQWRLTSDSQGNQTPLTNWETIDTHNPGSIGSSMSHSSGIFTYPSTGIYLVIFNLVGYSDNHTQNIIGYIEHTTNNSSYSSAAFSSSGIYDFNNSYPSWGNTSAMYMFDITDTSNQKTRFTYGAGQGDEYVYGNTGSNSTTVTFIRLGDT